MARKRSNRSPRPAPAKVPQAATGRRSALYSGAQSSRLTADWIFSACSSEQEVRQNISRMRARARDLERNNPTIRWYLSLLRSNVVGSQHPRLVSQVRDRSGNLDRNVNSYLEARFAEWATAVSTDGRLNLLRFAWQMMQRLPVDGEIFCRRVLGYPHNDFGYALELLEPDLLDENYTTFPGGRGQDIRLGVEVDEWRRPISYHFWDDYPSEGRGRQRVPLPALDVLHLFDVERANQTRGITWMKAILLSLKMLDGYFEGELVAARASAQKIAGLKYTDASAYEPRNPDEPLQIDSSPGEFFEIPPGMELETFDPQHPNSAFGPFVKGSHRLVASGLGTTYNTLANDAESVSWSTLRAFAQIERDAWQMLQGYLCQVALPWIYRGWLQAGILKGTLRLPSRDWRDYADHQFKPRGWMWVDPQNEAAAAQLKLKNCLASPQQILEPQGIDIEDVFEQRKAFREMAREYGEDPDKIEAAWISQGSLPADSTSNTDPSATADTSPPSGQTGA